jgi:hypothetical protein
MNLGGRPPSDNPRAHVISFRLTDDELRAVKRAAEQVADFDDESSHVRAWVRHVVLAAARFGPWPETVRLKARARQPERKPRRARARAAPTAPLPVEEKQFVAFVRDAIKRVGPEGRFGPYKVFIAAVYLELRIVDMTMAEFKARLVDANRNGTLSLARADLVGAMDPKMVAASEIYHMATSFHFVIDETQLPRGLVSRRHSISGDDDIHRVRMAFSRMVDAAPVGDVISIPALRRKVMMSKPRFDAAILALAERDEVALHLHDLPASLPKAERDALVVHPDGTHFVGIAPRRKR